MPNGTEMLAPDVLARIDNYSLLARTVVEGYLSGLHRSLYQGFGSEFFQYRNYVPGDDLKYVDWKVYARQNKVCMKVFQQETNLNCRIIIDTSNSMAYQGSKSACSKLKYASMVGSCLAYLSSRQGDNVGLYTYNSQLGACVPCGHSGGGLQSLLLEMARLQPEGKANHLDIMNLLTQRFDRRGIVVWISDFLKAEGDIAPILKRLRFQHQDLIIMQVLDKDETDFDFSGVVRFVDSEDNAEISTAPHLARRYYQEEMDAFLMSIKEACIQQQADFLTLTTDENLGHVLAAYLHRRESLS